MGLLAKIASLFGGGDGEGNVHREYVRCSRCGEKIDVRVDLGHELTPQYEEDEAAYYVHKGVIGSGENLCFQTIDVELTFDSQKRLISREIAGGEFITEEEFRSKES